MNAHLLAAQVVRMTEALTAMKKENDQLKGIVGFYKNLMVEIDEEVPYVERQYIEAEDDGQGGCWEDGDTHEGLLEYIKKMRKGNKVMEKQLVGLLMGVPTTKKQYDAWKSAMDEAKDI